MYAGRMIQKDTGISTLSVTETTTSVIIDTEGLYSASRWSPVALSSSDLEALWKLVESSFGSVNSDCNDGES